MKTTAILVIIPEFKNNTDVENWETNVNWAYLKYNECPLNEEPISTEKRWALGYVIWNKLIEYLNIKNVTVYFIRTDFRLIDNYTIDNNIISIKFDNNYGHIIYKTLISFEIIKDRFNYIIRGNANSIIDINSINKFVQLLPQNEVFTSPFWEGGNYSFGYFMLISNDILNYLIKQKKQYRWFNEDTADDYELTMVIIKKYKHFVIPGCDSPWVSVNHNKPLISNLNKGGLRLYDDNSEIIINNIKKSPDTVFLYRIKNITDNKYFLVYKFLMKHIWNKIVKYRFNDLIIYNESGNVVPHLDYERDEQLLVARYIDNNDVVLELGARYGSVSCIINKILDNKLNQVSVEPDSTVWNILEKNRKTNNCFFNIFKGIISDKNYELKLMGYGSTVDITNSLQTFKSIKSDNISLLDLQKKYGLTFNVLVADCEGFLETFLNENPFLYSQLDKIIFECDRADVCNYNYIKSELIKNNFKVIENGFQCVYIK